MYDLQLIDLLPLKKNGQKWASNIIEGINKSKEMSFDKLLFGLGIRFVGATVSKKLVSHFQNMDNLMAATFEELESVDEIGGKIAQSLVEIFTVPSNIELIHKLKGKGLSFVVSQSNSILSDKLKINQLLFLAFSN